MGQWNYYNHFLIHIKMDEISHNFDQVNIFEIILQFLSFTLIALISCTNANVVERAGQKLRNTISNSNPWKGSSSGRGDCVTCEQEDVMKIECRKRNVIYENICNLCNPRDEKEKRKTWEELEDKREEPSIYVGETSRSVAERARNHMKDMEGNVEDSHMLKHWENSHGGVGKPYSNKNTTI